MQFIRFNGDCVLTVHITVCSRFGMIFPRYASTVARLKLGAHASPNHASGSGCSRTLLAGAYAPVTRLYSDSISDAPHPVDPARHGDPGKSG